MRTGMSVKREPGYGYSLYINMDAADLESKVTYLLARDGSRLLNISGDGPTNNTQFAASWIFAEEPVWTWNSELSASAFQAAAST